MKQSLLIVGAGMYGAVARDIAQEMGCFDRIAFADDHATVTASGDAVLCRASDVEAMTQYDGVVVAIGNPDVRLSLLGRLREVNATIVFLVSPRAFVSPTATLGAGCIVEPMAVVSAGARLGDGCLVCAGAVVNHFSVCETCVQVDCNATVAGGASVPRGTKVKSNTVYG